MGIRHKAAAVFLGWAGQTFSYEALAGVLASTSICFDLSVFELFAPLSKGGKCLLVKDILEVVQSDFIGSAVRLINTVPSAIAAVSRLGWRETDLQVINLAGEPLSQELTAHLKRAFPTTQIFNLYGPTEDTTYSSYRQVDCSSGVNIGRPLANTQIYILD
ncbi:AMP-binding protein, partial [Burkholderia cepacia]|uniref:AMP-binding protein n=1 Tax=Burkholderia cepacia TaxID=292 RepID=UPI002AB73EEF